MTGLADTDNRGNPKHVVLHAVVIAQRHVNYNLLPDDRGSGVIHPRQVSFFLSFSPSTYLNFICPVGSGTTGDRRLGK
jgi:hypothetical protein